MGERRRERERLLGRGLAEALDRLGDARAEAPVGCRDPVFLLSAGWRSGSTLLQRLLASDGGTLMWGEPFGDRLPVHRMAQMLLPYAEGDAHSAYGIDRFAGELADEWIANLNPGRDALRSAHLAWFEALFAEPARARGYPRWGCKWVRLTAHHARYLRWLYPQAKLVLLVRHPLDALRSYLRQGEVWYLERPGLPVESASQFLQHWGDLAQSFLDAGPDLDALLLRYEDVVAEPAALKSLAEHVGSELDADVIGKSVGASRRGGRVPLPARLQMAWRLRELAGRLGYRADGSVCDPETTR